MGLTLIFFFKSFERMGTNSLDALDTMVQEAVLYGLAMVQDGKIWDSP